MMLAQPFQQTGRAQALQEGNVVFDGYYGWPNFFTTLAKAAYISSGQDENLKIGGIGPLGARAEYMVTDRVGVGIDLFVANSSLGWSERTTIFNPTTGNNEDVTYNYDLDFNRITALARFNYHFGSSDKFDPYAAVGAGYRSTSLSFTTNDPDFLEQSVGGALPIGIRLAAGGRYFFNDFIGINLEMALGGPLLSGGLSIKL